MTKSSLDKQIEKIQRDNRKQIREEKNRQRAEALRQRATTIISGQPFINNMRIMDETAELVLETLLEMRKEPNQMHISYDYESFPKYLQGSISLEMEKLIQYGMITSVLNWMDGGMLDLLPPALSYFEKKNKIVNNSDKDINEEDESMNKKVFIVHGHDNAAKQEMARTIEKAGFEAIILHEQADAGATIIEKIERCTNVAFAVVLYTECDYGRAKDQDVSDERYRARQNVVFEHGYLIGKLGREKVCAVVKGNVETPGDISGVVYTPMDENGAWKISLAKNMRAAGLEIDMNQWI